MLSSVINYGRIGVVLSEATAAKRSDQYYYNNNLPHFIAFGYVSFLDCEESQPLLVAASRISSQSRLAVCTTGDVRYLRQRVHYCPVHVAWWCCRGEGRIGGSCSPRCLAGDDEHVDKWNTRKMNSLKLICRLLSSIVSLASVISPVLCCCCYHSGCSMVKPRVTRLAGGQREGPVSCHCLGKCGAIIVIIIPVSSKSSAARYFRMIPWLKPLTSFGQESRDAITTAGPSLKDVSCFISPNYLQIPYDLFSLDSEQKNCFSHCAPRRDCCDSLLRWWTLVAIDFL